MRGEVIVHLLSHVINRDGDVAERSGDCYLLVSAVISGRAPEGVVDAAAEAKGSWSETQESASELFVPDTQVSVRGRIGGVVVREAAVAVIKSVAGIIDRAAALCVGAIADVAGIGEAIAEDNDLGKSGGRDGRTAAVRPNTGSALFRRPATPRHTGCHAFAAPAVLGETKGRE